MQYEYSFTLHIPFYNYKYINVTTIKSNRKIDARKIRSTDERLRGYYPLFYDKFYFIMQILNVFLSTMRNKQVINIIRLFYIFI